MSDTAIKCIIPFVSPLVRIISLSRCTAPPMTIKPPPSLSLHGACWLPSRCQHRVACDMQFTDARRRFEDKRGNCREGTSPTHSLFLKRIVERLPESWRIISSPRGFHQSNNTTCNDNSMYACIMLHHPASGAFRIGVVSHGKIG